MVTANLVGGILDATIACGRSNTVRPIIGQTPVNGSCRERGYLSWIIVRDHPLYTEEMIEIEKGFITGLEHAS